ncbi:MAG: hypothetical protein E6Z25_02550 [Negativicoccus succinicivorans]|nr:hypothetical protein HMPREF3224_02465 [Anaerococcus hydrogenalis]MDU5914931.1 hypothetical protein [Negativicoccus succinicivorans]
MKQENENKTFRRTFSHAVERGRMELKKAPAGVFFRSSNRDVNRAASANFNLTFDFREHSIKNVKINFCVENKGAATTWRRRKWQPLRQRCTHY